PPPRPSATARRTSHLNRSSALAIRRQSRPDSSSARLSMGGVLGRRKTAGAEWLRTAGRCREFIKAVEEQDAYRASRHLAGQRRRRVFATPRYSCDVVSG